MGTDPAVVPGRGADGPDTSPVDRRQVLEAAAWPYRTGARWDLYKNFDR
jgi:hypothetical protein